MRRYIKYIQVPSTFKEGSYALVGIPTCKIIV